MGAGPGGPGPHFHRTISESFYILEGSVAISDGDSWIDTELGDWILVPAGGIHGFKNYHRHGTPAAFEAAFGWGWLVELLEDYGFSPHLVHPLLMLSSFQGLNFALCQEV